MTYPRFKIQFGVPNTVKRSRFLEDVPKELIEWEIAPSRYSSENSDNVFGKRHSSGWNRSDGRGYGGYSSGAPKLRKINIDFTDLDSVDDVFDPFAGESSIGSSSYNNKDTTPQTKAPPQQDESGFNFLRNRRRR